MTYKELIQNLRICGKGGNCVGCELDGKCGGISRILADAADRLEALLAENEHLREATKMLGKDTNVPTKREKGTTSFDKLCHEIFDAGEMEYRARKSGTSCRCGNELEYYYCEEQLLLVECPRCKAKALVKARSPRDAAFKTFASTEGVE